MGYKERQDKLKKERAEADSLMKKLSTDKRNYDLLLAQKGKTKREQFLVDSVGKELDTTRQKASKARSDAAWNQLLHVTGVKKRGK